MSNAEAPTQKIGHLYNPVNTAARLEGLEFFAIEPKQSITTPISRGERDTQRNCHGELSVILNQKERDSVGKKLIGEMVSKLRRK